METTTDSSATLALTDAITRGAGGIGGGPHYSSEVSVMVTVLIDSGTAVKTKTLLEVTEFCLLVACGRLQDLGQRTFPPPGTKRSLRNRPHACSRRFQLRKHISFSPLKRAGGLGTSGEPVANRRSSSVETEIKETVLEGGGTVELIQLQRANEGVER